MAEKCVFVLERPVTQLLTVMFVLEEIGVESVLEDSHMTRATDSTRDCAVRWCHSSSCCVVLGLDNMIY